VAIARKIVAGIRSSDISGGTHTGCDKDCYSSIDCGSQTAASAVEFISFNARVCIVVRNGDKG
jgi:hypothetical protein